MNSSKFGYLFSIMLAGMVPASASAALITFDAVISGATSFGYDGDGDLVNDVLFSTTDPGGFNTVGPGTNMSYIDEPGIEGTTFLNPDLRVDFLNGAVGSMNFGFAMSAGTGLADGLTFDIFDSSNALLASSTLLSDFTSTGSGTSSFPEGLMDVSFGGIASYATFDFTNNDATRYIIDNFEGTFGSTEEISIDEPSATAVPAPASLALFGLGLAGLGMFRRRG